MAKLITKEIVPVARELNALIKPDPPITTDGTVTLKDMLKLVATAAGLLEPGDKISRETNAFFKKQEIDHKATVTASSDSKEKAKKTGNKKEAKKTTEKEKKAKSKKKEGYLRWHAIITTIKSMSKKGMTKNQIAEKANQLYIKNGGSNNVVSSIRHLQNVLPSFVILEIIRKEDDLYILV